MGVTTKYDRYDIDYSLDELKNLAKSLDYEVVGKITQSLDVPNPATYIGKGKLQEIILNILANSIDTVIFNDELSPVQLRNISEELNVEVMDRSYLILKIFELRAKSKESKIEIKLTKDLYLLPRIQFLREKESRIGGGASTATRGAGETQKELDRRHLMLEINKLKYELDIIRNMKMKQIEKRKRNDIPIVALVGYTNAGKSSTMNSILQYINSSKNKEVLEKNQLFSTLYTYNRLINYNKVEFMLVDTIGFVSKLPHNLINSFYSTLQEIKNADFIIHVVDSSTPYINQQITVVFEVLNQIGANNIPSIFLLNKWDKTLNKYMDTPGYKSIKYSNRTKENIDLLLQTILEEISPSFIHAKIIVPYNRGDLINIAEEKCQISNKSYEENGTYYELEIPKKLYQLFQEYDIDTFVS